ncbi:hypothetical protein quinque_015880 [Culex quinquefasciatus]
MNQYKSKVSSPTAGGNSATITNPFLSSPTTTPSAVDLFAGVDVQPAPSATIKTSDDLLQLGNPFADMFGAQPAPVAAAPIESLASVNDLWTSNGFNNTPVAMGSQPAPVAANLTDTFVSENNFTSVFGNKDALGESAPLATTAQQPGKVLTGDLDSSLASLAESLSINKTSSAQIKNVQWNSPKNTTKPGSVGWSPQPQPATNQSGYKPMAQGMTVCPAPSTIQPIIHTSYPVVPTYMLQQGMPQIRPMMNPMMGSPQPAGMVMQQSQPHGVIGQSPLPQPTQPSASATNIQLDPFGAL